MSGLVLLVATWNFWISYKNRYVELLVLHLLPLLNPWFIFYRYYFRSWSSELAQLVPLPYSWRRSSCFFDRLHNFSVTTRSYYKDVYVNSFFSRTSSIWNPLPIECFPLTSHLNSCKSTNSSWINKYISTVASFKTDFLYVLIFLCFLFL